MHLNEIKITLTYQTIHFNSSPQKIAAIVILFWEKCHFCVIRMMMNWIQYFHDLETFDQINLTRSRNTKILDSFLFSFSTGLLASLTFKKWASPGLLFIFLYIFQASYRVNTEVAKWLLHSLR